MPMTTSSTIVNASPLSVAVTVTNVPTGGGGQATVDIHVVVDRRFATPVNQAHNPNPDFVTGTTVSWVNEVFEVNDSRVYTAVFAQVAQGNPVCSTATVIVSGIDNGADYNNVGTPVICFP